MKRLLGLDGLRGIAVLLVIADHVGSYGWEPPEYFSWRMPSGHGVRLFFVLSGFLITSILLGARVQAPAGTVYRAFIIRRALRIFPAAYALLLFDWLAGVPELRLHGWWYVSYLANFRIVQLQDWPQSVGHLWSLAIEEQFYLVWPLIILWCPLRLVPWILSGLCMVALGLRGWFVHHGAFFTAYTLPFTRWDALAVGSLAAIVPLRVSGVLMFGFALWLVPHPAIEESALCVLSLGAVLASVSVARIASWLAWRPLTEMGRVSYAMYLWHPFVLSVYRPSSPIVGIVTTTAASYALALGLWTLFEGRLNDLKRYFPYAPRPYQPRSDAPSVP